jgi:hypothetical protein
MQEKGAPCISPSNHTRSIGKRASIVMSIPTVGNKMLCFLFLSSLKESIAPVSKMTGEMQYKNNAPTGVPNKAVSWEPTPESTMNGNTNDRMPRKE